MTVKDLPVKALVKDVDTRYYGVPIVWKIADKDHAGYPADSATLCPGKILSLKCFDAIEPENSDADRKSGGNNRWTYSNIRQWLNSQAAAGQWYTAQHSADAPPTKAASSGYNGYDTEAGFLAGFSANMRAALLSTTRSIGKAPADGGGTETCVDKIFFATCTEVGLTGDVAAGSKLALFSDNASRIAYPAAECVANSDFSDAAFSMDKPWYWWLCNAYASSSYYAYFISSTGALSYASVRSGNIGILPFCNIQFSTLVSDTPDSDGVYTLFPPQGVYVKKNGIWAKATGILTKTQGSWTSL